MADSKRKTILNYLRDTTLAVITTGNGYNTTIQSIKRGIEPLDKLPDSSFPALYITTTREDRQNITRIDYQSRMRIAIECYVKRSNDVTGLQEDLDDVIEDVTIALEQDRLLGGNVAKNLEIMEVTTDDGDVLPFGAAVIIVEVMFTSRGTLP